MEKRAWRGMKTAYSYNEWWVRGHAREWGNRNNLDSEVAQHPVFAIPAFSLSPRTRISLLLLAQGRRQRGRVLAPIREGGTDACVRIDLSRAHKKSMLKREREGDAHPSSREKFIRTWRAGRLFFLSTTNIGFFSPGGENMRERGHGKMI